MITYNNVCSQIEVNSTFTTIAGFMLNNEKFLTIKVIGNSFA